jgi:hypothetical protein
MDRWTDKIEEAAGFRDTLTALKFCQRNNLHGAAVVHVFDGGLSQRVAGFYRRATQPSVPEDRPKETLDQEESLS